MEQNDFLNEIMGYDPNNLDIFKEPETTAVNKNIYKTLPESSKAEDGHYRSQVRLLLNPFSLKDSIVPNVHYRMRDIDGAFYADSLLSKGDKNCPIFKAWKRLHFSDDPKKKEFADNMFDKTESRWVLVQVLDDDNQPELKGKFLCWKLPKGVFTKLTAKMNPPAESKKQRVPVMDYLFGVALDIDVTPGPDDPKNPQRKKREISYDLCEFGSDIAPIINTDGTSLFTDDELTQLEEYNTKKNAIAKAKTAADREKKQKDLDGMLADIKKLYAKAVDYIKQNAPDVVKECGYTEWSEELTARVNRWLALVAQMKDPTLEDTVTVNAADAEQDAPTTTASEDVFRPEVDLASDLPCDEVPF